MQPLKKKNGVIICPICNKPAFTELVTFRYGFKRLRMCTGQEGHLFRTAETRKGFEELLGEIVPFKEILRKYYDTSTRT